MPVTVEANIVLPMKFSEMAERSSGMLARNVTPWLMSPTGGGAACDAVPLRGRTSAAATRTVRSRPMETGSTSAHGSLLHRDAQVPALPERHARVHERWDLLGHLDALGQDGRPDLGGEGHERPHDRLLALAVVDVA